MVTIGIKEKAKCYDEGALHNARDAAGVGHLLHELVCAGGIKRLDTGEQKALRVSRGSQRLLMPGENLCGPLRQAAKDSEDDELPWEKNQWCALLDASFHFNVSSMPLHYMRTTSTTSLSATCMFANCTAPVVRDIIDESKWYPLSWTVFV